MRGIRDNFKNLYQSQTNCPLNCSKQGSPPSIDNQKHLLECPKLQQVTTLTLANKKIQYEDIYGDVFTQKAAVSLFKLLLEKREKIINKED